MSSPRARTRRSGWRGVPRTVWVLGLVSLFMDASSEMIHALLPVFLVSTLGASATLVGLIEGIAEATGSVAKVFSGVISDRFGRRKRLVALGYALAALTKPVFAVAVTPFEVLAARFVDRVAKGIRGAPRDALVADVTRDGARGAAYGVRQALDTVGAFLGPALAIGLMAAFDAEIREVFAIAIIPAAIAAALVVFGVEEPRSVAAGSREPARLSRHDLRSLETPYWVVLAIAATFTLARFSEAFLVLRAQEVGLRLAFTPLVLIAMSLVYAGVSAPAGSFSDRVDRRLVLAAGVASLGLSDLVLAFADSSGGVLVGAGLWGLHMGLTQGPFSAMIADTAPARLRATAFGLFNLVTGASLLLASFLAGVLWERVGSTATFLCGAVISSMALAGLLVARMR